MAELDVTAGAGRVLPGSLRGKQVLDLSVEGLDGGINLVVLGSQSRLISSVLIISRNVISTTSRAGRSGQTRRSRRSLICIREWINMLTRDAFGLFVYNVKFNCLLFPYELIQY